MRNNPYIRSLEIKRISYDIGFTYRIFVKAYNEVSESASPILGVIFATTPDKPPVPVKVIDKSNTT